MESLDSLIQRLIEVGQKSLETAYAHATLICQSRRVGTVVGHRVGNKEADSPIVLAILVVEFAIGGGHHGKGLTHRVRNLRLDVLGNGLDIIHHARHIGEDDVVLALKDVVGRRALGLNDKCIVNKSLAQSLNRGHSTLKGKVRGNLKKFFLVHIFIY